MGVINRNEDEDNRNDGAAVGCLLLIIGACALIGGLFFFIRVIIALYTGTKL